MKHRNYRFSLALALALIACGVFSVHAYEAFQGPTELIQYDPAKASHGVHAL